MIIIDIWWYFLILCILFSSIGINKVILNKIIAKRKGVKKAMPVEFLKEFLGKVCTIVLFNDAFGITGKIVAIESSWIKVETKNDTRIINGDMIVDIICKNKKN